MANQNKGKEIMISAVVGGVLGAVTALLFAPKSGKELRSDISEQYTQISEKTEQLAEAVSRKTQEITKNVSSQTSEWVDKAKVVATQVAEEVRSWREQEQDAEATEQIESSEAAEDLVIVSSRT